MRLRGRSHGGAIGIELSCGTVLNRTVSEIYGEVSLS